jgi:hypothetical protein
MKFLEVTKDGGPESTVWAHWLIELKGLFSIVLLRFEDGSRDAYHSHAFDAISWVLSGELDEELRPTELTLRKWVYGETTRYWPSLTPIITRRDTTHKVTSHGRTWVLSFRGPWAKTWDEYAHGWVKARL